MSLEQAISDHAAAIRELAAAIRNSLNEADVGRALLTVAGASDAELQDAVAKVETDAKAEQKKVMAQVEADRKAVAAKPLPTNAKDAVAEAKALAAAAKEQAKPLSYDADIKPALVKLLTKNKPAGLALFGEFGVANGQGLSADQYPAVLARINVLLAA